MDDTKIQQGRYDTQRSHGQRVMRGYYLIVVLFASAMLCLLVVSQLQADILDSVRAYVAGEGRWSKGQKDAVYRLIRYSFTHDGADYQAFMDGVGVTLGDKQARLAMQQSEVDRGKARAGFLRGGNHPNDVDKMIDFFVDYQRVGKVREAIEFWTEGDAKIAELQHLGESLRAEIASGSANRERIDSILWRVGDVDRQLTVLENRFSATLGEAARWSKTLTHNVVIGSMLLLLGIVLLLSWRIVRGIRQTERALIASEARFRHVVESNMLGILFWGEDDGVSEANDAFLQMVGYSREELESGVISWRRLTSPEHRQGIAMAHQEIREHGFCAPYEQEIMHKDGHRVVTYVGGALLDGPAKQGVTFVLDISKSREAEQMQRVATTVFQSATEAIVVTDNTPVIQAVNPAFTVITGYTEDEVIGKNPSILGSDHHDGTFFREMWRELAESDRWRGEIWNRHKDGQVYPEWLSIGAIRDQRNQVAQYVGIFSDISDRKAKENVIWHQAHYDLLTDLPNRALFRDRLMQQIALAKRERILVGVMFIDLDRFKPVNDTLGHRAGDLLLQEVANRMRGSVREADTVARLSGDEFAVILPHLHHARDAEQVAETIIDSCSSPYTVAGRQVTVTVSIGIACYPNDGLTVDELLTRSDVAMYAAKSAGGSRYRFHASVDDSVKGVP